MRELQSPRSQARRGLLYPSAESGKSVGLENSAAVLEPAGTCGAGAPPAAFDFDSLSRARAPAPHPPRPGPSRQPAGLP